MISFVLYPSGIMIKHCLIFSNMPKAWFAKVNPSVGMIFFWEWCGDSGCSHKDCGNVAFFYMPLLWINKEFEIYIEENFRICKIRGDFGRKVTSGRVG